MTQFDDVQRGRPPGPAQLVLGSMVAAFPRRSRASQLGYMALGLICLAEDGVRGAARAGERVGRVVAPVGSRLIPPVVGRTLGEPVRRLSDRGRAVAIASPSSLTRIADGLVDELVRTPFMLRSVEKIVDALLPGVIESLANDPDRIRALVESQSRGMATELARTARTRAVEGDEVVDRLLARFLHRTSTRRRQVDALETVRAAPGGLAPQP